MRSIVAVIHGRALAKKRALAQAHLEVLRATGAPLEVVETRYAGHATKIVEERLGQDVDFASLGGDGTHFEVLNGLFPRVLSMEDPPRLWPMALGTGNSFLKDFPPSDRRARRCDVIQATHDRGAFYFMNLLSLGFVGDVAELRNRRFSQMGDLGYVVAVVLKTLSLRPVPFSLRVDGVPLEGDQTFLSFNNSQCTGGDMKMAPGARTDDGFMDLLTVAPMGRWELLSTFPKIFTGKHVEHPKVSLRKVREVEFVGQREYAAMVDGETGRYRFRSLRVLPSALEIVA